MLKSSWRIKRPWLSIIKQLTKEKYKLSNKHYRIYKDDGKINKYKTKQTLYFLVINKFNLNKIINIVKTKLEKGLTFLDGSKLNKNEVLFIIRKYSNVNKGKIIINTGEKGLYKFGKYTFYLGLWFAKIICFFGFDGYYVPKKIYEKI